jgi:hypothetical protein
MRNDADLMEHLLHLKRCTPNWGSRIVAWIAVLEFAHFVFESLGQPLFHHRLIVEEA